MIHSIGIFGFASTVNSVAIKQWKLLGYKGVRLCLKWSVMQPTETDLSFTTVFGWIKLLVEAELDMNIQVWVGNFSPIGGTEMGNAGKIVPVPDWLAKKGVNVFYTTGATLTGPWPNYYEQTYMDAFNNLHAGFANFLNGLPLDYKARIKSVFISNGATGDGQPYKGTVPAGWEHIKDDDTWNNYCEAQWQFCAQQYAKNSSFMVLALNPNNDGEMITFCTNNFPDCYMKHGDASHEFPIEGETYKMNWPKTQWFGEVDDQIKNALQPCVQFQCIRSALHVNTQRLEFLPEWLTNRYVPVFVEFFHKYVDEIYNDNPSRGFCALAEKVNYLNTTDYPTDMFGPLWDDQRLYDGSIKNVDRNYPDRWQREMKYVQVSMGRSSAGRLARFKDAGYPRGVDRNTNSFLSADYYNNDVAYYVTNNYYLHLYQLLPFQTSAGVFRVDQGSVYGRNARQFKLYNAKSAMYFQANPAMQLTPLNDKVRITVTYKDVGVTVWSIKCAFAQVCRVTNTNTNEWKKAIFDIDNFKWGGKMENGSDIIINLIRGTLFPIDMVEIENIDKEDAAYKEFDVLGETGIIIGEIELDPEDAEDPGIVIGAEEAEADDNE